MRTTRLALCAAVIALCLSAAAAPAAPAATPLDGDTMWIWLVPRSSGGDVEAIIAKAQRYGVENVVIKGANGPRAMAQFSRGLVSELKAAGLRVCAYQYVYGRKPRTEAAAAARVVRRGADCLMIDAETEYEGRYWQAQLYMRRLRAKVGPTYPLGLTSFPFVHYHRGFPYSVFLGPGGADFNVPQMYWKAIGVGVDRIFSITYRYNALYKRPILPLGQTYDHPRPAQIRRFRLLARRYGASGVSWWSWQASSTRDWRAVGVLLPAPLEPAVAPPARYPTLRRRSRGDLVVWAQQHLRAAGIPVRVDGVYGARMQSAVFEFQEREAIFPTGSIGPGTWPALLKHAPAAVRWRKGRRAARPVLPAASAPASATLSARRDELRGTGVR
jgi:putative peptidoglycan binding protein